MRYKDISISMLDISALAGYKGQVAAMIYMYELLGYISAVTQS